MNARSDRQVVVLFRVVSTGRLLTESSERLLTESSDRLHNGFGRRTHSSSHKSDLSGQPPVTALALPRVIEMRATNTNVICDVLLKRKQI